MSGDKNYIVISFLWRLQGGSSLSNNENENFYKKCRGYYKFWQKQCEKSDELIKWFITVGGISRFIEYYMEKKSTSYDRKQGFSLHEHALEPLLRTVMHVAEYVVRCKGHVNEYRQRSSIILNPHDMRNLTNHNFFEKMMKENYSSNNYVALKRLIRVVCENNDNLSSMIIATCFTRVENKRCKKYN